MKKTNKVHPITFFRKANEARQAAVKKSIKKAQDGRQVGPMTQEQAAEEAFRSADNDPANNPYANTFTPTPMRPVEMPGPIINRRGGSVKRKKK